MPANFPVFNKEEAKERMLNSKESMSMGNSNKISNDFEEESEQI
tara:strand:- start:359 stop:490 length:132 start_codon:yes stop_codon:yes gene_type:complete